MKHNNYIILLSIIAALNGCMDDDGWYELNDLELKQDTLLADYIEKEQGVFIVNEGNFMFDNASLSYYIPDSLKVFNEIFYRTNGVPLGDVAQSMTISDSLGYIVVNNSSKIYVININTFEYVGKITGFTSPRYIHFISDDKAYVSDLYAGAISIIDPTEFKITGSINIKNPASKYLQHPSEQMLQYENRVFTNCWSFDNKILVIDSDTDELIDSVTVPLQPNSMVLDCFSKIWILCDGGYQGNPAGNERPALVRLDPVSLRIEKTYYFELDQQPGELSINPSGDTLYLLNKDVFRHAVLSELTPERFIISPYVNKISGGFYGLDVDPLNGDIYVADAIDQVQRGQVYRFSSTGAAIDTFRTGISPGAFCFTAK